MSEFMRELFEILLIFCKLQCGINLLSYITLVVKKNIWYLSAIEIIDTQVARRGRQYHRNPPVSIISMNKIVGGRTQGFLDDQTSTMKDGDIKQDDSCSHIRRRLFYIVS